MSDLGKITRCFTVRYRRKSPHAPERIWRAITSSEEVRVWMGYPAQIDLRVGGRYHITFGEGEGNLDGVIVRVDATKTLAYVWGTSVIEWILEPDGAGCGYDFVHHGQSPGSLEEDVGLLAGWHAWLDDLDAHLDGRAATAARWEQLQPAYRERLTVLGA